MKQKLIETLNSYERVFGIVECTENSASILIDWIGGAIIETLEKECHLSIVGISPCKWKNDMLYVTLINYNN